MLKISAVFLICGFALGTVYDVLRFLGLLSSKKATVFLFDFFFFVIFSLLFFVLLLGFNNGIVRMMYLAAYFAGFVFYLLIVGRKSNLLRSKAVEKLKTYIKNQKQSFKKVLQFVHKLYYNKLISRKKPLSNKLKFGGKNGKAFSQFKRK